MSGAQTTTGTHGLPATLVPTSLCFGLLELEKKKGGGALFAWKAYHLKPPYVQDDIETPLSQREREIDDTITSQRDTQHKTKPLSRCLATISALLCELIAHLKRPLCSLRSCSAHRNFVFLRFPLCLPLLLFFIPRKNKIPSCFLKPSQRSTPPSSAICPLLSPLLTPSSYSSFLFHNTPPLSLCFPHPCLCPGFLTPCTSPFSPLTL